MATDIIHRQRLRGSSVQNNEYTGLEGEITVDLTNKNLRLHDGQTIGGTVIPNISSLADFLKKTGDTMTGKLTFSNGKSIDDYLPLSGGTVNGVLTFSVANALRRNDTDSNLTIYGGSSWNNGAYINLRGGSNSSGAGMFTIGAILADGSGSVLDGTAAGSLKWKSKEVERLDSSGTNSDKTEYWWRFASGLQIIQGSYVISNVNNRGRNYSVAFSHSVCPVIAYGDTPGYTQAMCVGGYDGASFWVSNSSNSYPVRVSYTAIGRWK